MATRYIYPLSEEIQELSPERTAADQRSRAIFEIMPIEDTQMHLVSFEVRDAVGGLQNLRGLDGEPRPVKKAGRQKHTYAPGVYGDFVLFGEEELTAAAGPQPNSVANIDTEVLDAQGRLIIREDDRIEYVGWRMLLYGVIEVPLSDGSVGYRADFPVQEVTGSDWDDTANSTVLEDFRTVKATGQPGGSQFGAGATAWMNSTTASNMILSKGGALNGYFAHLGQSPIRNRQNVASILAAEDLPTPRVYDGGWVDEIGAIHGFIPNGKVLVVGTRPNANERVCAYRRTRNASTGTSQPYNFIRDFAQGVNAPKTIPPKIEVHRGHNGGPVIYRPSAIRVLNV